MKWNLTDLGKLTHSQRTSDGVTKGPAGEVFSAEELTRDRGGLKMGSRSSVPTKLQCNLYPWKPADWQRSAPIETELRLSMQLSDAL